MALASEITGSLSSDGDSSPTNQEVLLGDTDITDDEASGPVVAQSSGNLQGSVVQGRDESAAVATISSWNAEDWLIPLAGGIALAILAFFLWNRKLV